MTGVVLEQALAENRKFAQQIMALNSEIRDLKAQVKALETGKIAAMKHMTLDAIIKQGR